MNTTLSNNMRVLSEEAAKHLGLEGLPSELRDEIILQIGETIWKHMILDVLDAISQEAREHCKQLVERKAADELYEFFTKQVPNFENIAHRSAEHTIAEILKR